MYENLAASLNQLTAADIEEGMPPVAVGAETASQDRDVKCDTWRAGIGILKTIIDIYEMEARRKGHIQDTELWRFMYRTVNEMERRMPKEH